MCSVKKKKKTKKKKSWRGGGQEETLTTAKQRGCQLLAWTFFFERGSTIFPFTSPLDRNYRHLSLRRENLTIIVPIWTKYIISANRKYNSDIAALDLWNRLVYAGWFTRFELSISFTVSIYKQAWIIKKGQHKG